MKTINDLLQLLIQDLEPRSLARNEFLLKAGEIERYVYFIRDGAVRVFLVSEFEEHTIRFAYTNSVFTSLSSFLTGKPSEFFLQALRKTTVYAIPKDVFLSKVQEDAEGLKLYCTVLEELVIQQMEREIDLLTNSPAERLKRVLLRSPQLFQEIPSRYIASYLRMTPETLSRIR